MTQFNPAHPYLEKAAEDIAIASMQSDLGLALIKIEDAQTFLRNASDIIKMEKARLRRHSDYCQACWLGDHDR